MPGVSGGGWCLGAPGLAWLGAEPKAFPPSWFTWRIQCLSAPALGTSPCCACSLPCSWHRSIPCPATSWESHSPGSPALALPISCPKLEGVEPVWWDRSQLPLLRGAASTVADASEPSRSGSALSLPVLGLSPLPHFLFLPAVAAFAQGAGVGPAGLFPPGLFPPVPRAPNPALGSAQRARELLC